MSSRHTLPANYGPTSAGTRYWVSEFERIHLMAAARLRGEPLPFRPRVRISE